MRHNSIQLNFMDFYKLHTTHSIMLIHKKWWMKKQVEYCFTNAKVQIYSILQIEFISTKQCDSRLKFTFLHVSNTKTNKITHKIQKQLSAVNIV